MLKRIEKFENRSPGRAKISEIKQKLPFLQNEQYSKESSENRQGVSPGNSSMGKQPVMDSTVTSFASRGLQLKKMELEILKHERAKELSAASPLVRKRN